MPHIDYHNLATRPIFIDDNAKPHRARVVSDYLRRDVTDTTFGSNTQLGV